MSIASQLCIRGYGADTLSMYGVEVLVFGCASFSSLSSSCLSLPRTLPGLTRYNITASLFLLPHHLHPPVDTLSHFISSTSFSFSAPGVSMVTTFILLNLWSSGSSPPGHYRCFIQVNFILFSIPVDTLSLPQCFSSISHCSDELVIFRSFTHH